ncbi:OmpA family protein [Yoonia sp.]|uniref:OmpA family protein n=1 Tax=Yoonia sp. TaxID=2212373 RepID=UPI003F6A6529
MIFLRVGIFLAMATTAGAQVLDFPSNASLQQTDTRALDSYVMPMGIWDRGAMPTEVVEGQLTQQAWRIDAAGLTTLQLLRPLREQLRNAGYQIIFDCQTEACGGFDFRFAVDTLPPPEMQINIGDFRFLTARRDAENGPDYISLFVSRTAQAGFVQVTQVTAPGAGAPETAPLAMADAKVLQPQSGDQDDLAARLETVGHAVLDDLTFDTGSSELAAGDFASLRALADYLQADPGRAVALVGHTDAQGALETNIALSKRRAGSVLERLVADYGVNRRQLAAEGMGYLAPIASNLTEQGRETNRRVEAIITSTND